MCLNRHFEIPVVKTQTRAYYKTAGEKNPSENPYCPILKFEGVCLVTELLSRFLCYIGLLFNSCLECH